MNVWVVMHWFELGTQALLSLSRWFVSLVLNVSLGGVYSVPEKR
jgi:hypothetical protein